MWIVRLRLGFIFREFQRLWDQLPDQCWLAIDGHDFRSFDDIWLLILIIRIEDPHMNLFF
jgi:hypothetical protein